jgi:cholera toxin transcriptional activator
VETLARRGYRFVAPVERIGAVDNPQSQISPSGDPLSVAESVAAPTVVEPEPRGWILASAHELPKASHRLVQTLFLLLQLMYLSFYVGALANLPEIEGLLSALPHAASTFTLLIVTAAMLIPVRTFMLCAVLMHAPRVRPKLLRIWPFLLPFDVLWALSPFLLLHHIDFGVALACTALLVYSPFAQRSLVLMGAGGDGREQH